MNRVLIFVFFFSFLFGVDNQKLLDCYDIFEQKKMELERKAEAILEQQEAFEAFKNSSLHLIKKKKEELEKKEKELNLTLQKIESEKKSIEELVKKNQKLLEEIKNAKLTKITTSFSKMRPKNAAVILENLPPKDAIDILIKLKPKTLSKIFAKMDPKKASTLIEMMQDSNSTK